MIINGNNISMTRGDSGSIIVTCIQIDGTTVPLVPGDIVYFTVKKGTSDTSKTLQKIITEFDSEGKAIINILPIDTRNISPGAYKYDVQLNSPKLDGAIDVSTIIEPADFILKGDITYE